MTVHIGRAQPFPPHLPRFVPLSAGKAVFGWEECETMFRRLFLTKNQAAVTHQTELVSIVSAPVVLLPEVEDGDSASLRRWRAENRNVIPY